MALNKIELSWKCPVCGRFHSGPTDKRYCSDICRYKDHQKSPEIMTSYQQERRRGIKEKEKEAHAKRKARKTEIDELVDRFGYSETRAQQVNIIVKNIMTKTGKCREHAIKKWQIDGRL